MDCEVQNVNHGFLVDSSERKIGFDYFEIEKINSEHVFLVNISSTFSDNIDVEVSKSKMALLLNLEMSIHRMHLPSNLVKTNMEFKLPEYVETEGAYLNKNGTNIFLIFHKKQVVR